MLNSSFFNGLSDNHRSAAFMMLAMAGYVLNDTATKLISEEFSVFQLIFVRGIILSSMIGVMMWRQGETLNPFISRDRMLWLRVSCEVLLSFLFLTALFNMPLANMNAIVQITPLALTLVLALLFGERVGWRRYLAIAIGFCGILLIIRPGTNGFNVYSLLALLAVATIIVRDIATQHAKTQTSSLSLVYVTAIMATLVNGVILLFIDWDPITVRGVSGATASAVFIFFGYLFSVLTMRVGEASYTAPFRYSGLVYAIIISIVVFNDIPDALTLLGCAIVACAGLYTLHRERQQRATP